jgi:ribosomal protein S18 acetylase RimI-like enzyme
VEVRPADLGDSAAIAEAHVTSWQVAYKGLLPDEVLGRLDVQRRTDFWREQIAEGAPVLVAAFDGAVVGFSSYGAARHDDQSWGEIYAIYVLPGYWGAGHGHRLITATESALFASGYRQALLWVLDSNLRARQFYERQGWMGTPTVMKDTIGQVEVIEVRYQKTLS